MTPFKQLQRLVNEAGYWIYALITPEGDTAPDEGRAVVSIITAPRESDAMQVEIAKACGATIDEAAQLIIDRWFRCSRFATPSPLMGRSR